jgi:hypothetical protein
MIQRVSAVPEPKSGAICGPNTSNQAMQFRPKILDINIFPHQKTIESSKIGILRKWS